MKKILLVTTLTFVISLITYILLPPQIPHSPLGNASDTLQTKKSENNYVVMGFAPYWNMKKLNPDSLKSITHFAYFALHLRGDGSLYTHVNPKEEDPGYTNYKRLLASPVDNNLILTYMQQDEDALRDMLSTNTARQTAINTIISSVSESGAIGVNIDLEPVGEITPTLRNNFTLFIKDLHSELKKRNSPLLTISIYASAAARARLWDLTSLSPLTDYFVVMTYDYTMPRSTHAGPNSPLRDFSGEFEHNILKNLGELTSVVPANKLLLGIPLYGYQWDTVDSDRYSPTESRGVTASLERIESMLAERTLELVWDRNSLTPYGVSTESGTTSQIYFENEASIRLKLDLVKSAGLGGIALWALGYDNNVGWLWPTINALNWVVKSVYGLQLSLVVQYW